MTTVPSAQTNTVPPRKLTTFTRVVVLIACYFVGGIVGKETSFLSGSVALVWPPAGIALAAILLFGYRFTSNGFMTRCWRSRPNPSSCC